jgi:hypothetical protein
VRSHEFKLFKLYTLVLEDGGGETKHVARNVRFYKFVVFDGNIEIITGNSTTE